MVKRTRPWFEWFSSADENSEWRRVEARAAEAPAPQFTVAKRPRASRAAHSGDGGPRGGKRESAIMAPTVKVSVGSALARCGLE
eukprot:5146895-Prymnesium_polylepis.1